MTLVVADSGPLRYLDLDTTFQRLTATNFRIDRVYLEEALKRDRARVERERDIGR